MGCHVTYIKEPVDLVVGFRGRTILLECKDAKTGRLTKPQEVFFATFTGEAYIVQTPEQARQAVRVSAQQVGNCSVSEAEDSGTGQI